MTVVAELISQARDEERARIVKMLLEQNDKLANFIYDNCSKPTPELALHAGFVVRCVADYIEKASASLTVEGES